jgi:hypothetical protein
MEELRDSAALRAAFSGDPLLLCAGAATDPNFRSQRLAERVCGLVSHTLVSERGRAALIADTWNTAAIALYQRLGPGWPDLAQPESERAVIDHCFPEYGEGFRRASRTCVARAVILPEVRSGGRRRWPGWKVGLHCRRCSSDGWQSIKPASWCTRTTSTSGSCAHSLWPLPELTASSET